MKRRCRRAPVAEVIGLILSKVGLRQLWFFGRFLGLPDLVVSMRQFSALGRKVRCVESLGAGVKT